jgi:DNA-nicking Smr family endonuclease
MEGEEQPIDLPIGPELDLHGFRPQDVKDVLLDYVEACREKRILEVRVVHGKGIGQLRQTVHACLGKHPDVLSFAPATEPFGGAGATWVKLKPSEDSTNP